MACSCITTFNYAVEFQDCNTIIYNDMSVWVEVPETYTIVITYSGGTLTQVVSTSESTIIEETSQAEYIVLHTQIATEML